MTKRKAAPGDVCEFDLGDGRCTVAYCAMRASRCTARQARFGEQPPIGARTSRSSWAFDEAPEARLVPSWDGTHYDPNDAWPPPHKVVDPITQRVRIYHHGEIHEASNPAAAEKLEKAAVWDLQHLIIVYAARFRVDRGPTARRSGFSRTVGVQPLGYRLLTCHSPSAQTFHRPTGS